METQNHFKHNNLILTSGCLLTLLVLTFVVYYPGINGIFGFDDLPNLSPMGKYSDYNFWDRFWLFTLEGRAGPTGRPLSLASFYLNDFIARRLDSRRKPTNTIMLAFHYLSPIYNLF